MNSDIPPQNNQEEPGEVPLMEDPLAELEKIFIHRYLNEKGYRWCELLKLPAEELKIIMTEACMYASARLAEVEAMAGFRKEIRYK